MYVSSLGMIDNDFIVDTVPDTVMYLPNFISCDEEREILNKVYSAPKPKWTQLRNRRLQNWGGIPHPKGMIPEKIPEWLQKYMNRINDLNIFGDNSPNHVLINEYTAGQGIMPHTDGPLFHPVISTINCGSHVILQFQFSGGETDESLGDENCDGREKQDDVKSEKKTFSLLLEPRSLLILKDDVYKKYLHRIDEILEDEINDEVGNLHLCQNEYKIGQHLQRTTRISLTVRNVPRCSNFKLRF